MHKDSTLDLFMRVSLDISYGLRETVVRPLLPHPITQSSAMLPLIPKLHIQMNVGGTIANRDFLDIEVRLFSNEFSQLLTTVVSRIK